MGVRPGGGAAGGAGDEIPSAGQRCYARGMTFWPMLLCSTLAAAPPAATGRAVDEDSGGSEEVEVEVASRAPLTARQAPNVVSVILRDEIEAAGVRDLLDLLLLVPGFAAGTDVSGVVDVGFRGLWGHEGKVLFLLDGQEMNETLYSTMQLGGRIPIDLVERVEVIRGPGSVVYGGYAELAVISIITRRPRDPSGASVSVEYGQMSQTFGHATATASWSGPVARVPDLAASVSLGYSESVRAASGTFQDFAGDGYPIRSNAGLSDMLVDVGLQYGGLQIRAIHDDYRVSARVGQGSVLPATDVSRFASSFLEARYLARPGSRLTITPRIAYKLQTPWQVLNSSSPNFYDKTVDRLLGGLTLTWDPVAQIGLLAGVEGFWDRARANDLTQSTLFGSRSSVDYQTFAGHGQISYRSPFANLFVGARYEYNDAVKGSFVPRAGLTSVLGRLNLKLLYSEAYRAPGIENINVNPAIRPERTRIAEAEVGVQLGGHVALLANGYWIRMERPIVYDVIDTSTGAEAYLNGARTGTVGAEAQLRVKYSWAFANLGYSFYTANGQNRESLFAVPGREDLLIGFPRHKVAGYAGLHLRKDVVLGGTGVWMSRRHGLVRGDGAGNPVPGAEPPLLLLGANLTYRNVGAKGLDLSAGVQNLLDERHRVLQPFDGGHAPLPMAGREVVFRVAYRQPSQAD